jgi:hemerythrin-like domain-containing protein
MKRHAALVPLSHDHHHALVEARRLMQSADDGEAVRLDAVERFLAFYAADTIEHFREEEERLFPLVVDQDDAANELLLRALLEHQRIHACAQRLRESVATGSADAAVMRQLGDLLHAHVRLEERELFPLIETTVSEQALAEIAIEPREPGAERQVVELMGPVGTGPLWGTQTDDLNATLLAWPAGGGPGGEQRNSERDVLLVVLEGEATVTLDGDDHDVRAGQALVVEKGRTRRISAGADGVRYLSIHVRRSPLQIGRFSSP